MAAIVILDDSKQAKEDVLIARRFYTPTEAAQQLGVSSTTVMNLIHGGRLPAVRVSERIYRIPIPAFERFASGEAAPDFGAPRQAVEDLSAFGESVAETARARQAAPRQAAPRHAPACRRATVNR